MTVKTSAGKTLLYNGTMDGYVLQNVLDYFLIPP